MSDGLRHKHCTFILCTDSNVGHDNGRHMDIDIFSL